MYSHLECQTISYQADAVLGALDLSHLEEQDDMEFRGAENIRRKAYTKSARGNIPDFCSPTLACGIIGADPSGYYSGEKEVDRHPM